jgi:hypothetical protein
MEGSAAVASCHGRSTDVLSVLAAGKAPLLTTGSGVALTFATAGGALLASLLVTWLTHR